MNIKVCCFSPAGATKQVAQRLAIALGGRLDAGMQYCSYTLPQERQQLPEFGNGDLVLWATPVYAGRVPNKTLDYVRQALRQRQAMLQGLPAVALVTFGNRAYDNALAELTGMMQESGLRVVGAAAVVTRHSFSNSLGAGRPSAEDWEALSRFASKVASKVAADCSDQVQVPGLTHPAEYYTPLKTNNTPAGFLKAKPSCTEALCLRCGRCAEVCPVGSIVCRGGLPRFEGVCIKCQACRRECPAGAIAFTDPEYCSHVAMIERTFAEPKLSQFFV